MKKAGVIAILEEMSFRFDFRKHQKMMLDAFERKFSAFCEKVGKQEDPGPDGDVLVEVFQFHLTSPPGSGKTIVGMEIAKRIGAPVLVICPNTTIQGQWVDKLRMFFPENATEIETVISTDPEKIRKINVFTYQLLSVPCSEEDATVRLAENLWAEAASATSGSDIGEALLRIGNMRTANPEAYKRELSKFTRKLRESRLYDTKLSLSSLLHPNAIKLIAQLKENRIDTILFDECHHLQNYWALVMKEVIREMCAHYIIGLTATPPAEEDGDSLELYMSLLGEIDFQIPVPAVIKEGMLAPFRDMVYFCRPTEEELSYITNCHQKFEQLKDRFNRPDSEFTLWISDRILNRRLLSGEKQDWTKFVTSRGSFAVSGVKFLLSNQCKIPWDITVTEVMYEPMSLEDWLNLIEDYSLNCLKLSAEEANIHLLGEIKEALRSLGYLLTENGIRSQGSMLDRILAYSRSKQNAVKEILKAESRFLKGNMRAAVITDFERSNALVLKKADSIMDEECGGAFRMMRELVSDEVTDRLDPVMVTGTSLICDDDLAGEYVRLGREWAEESGLEIGLIPMPAEGNGFAVIEGSGKDWSSKTAVLLTTQLFEKGVTKCIIGTRGLLSEGWDSLNLNTLIDLSTATTFATVNQLRGRSIRLSKDDPDKLSDNWDVICAAPGFEKGYNDLERLFRKHSRFYGICDDGQIQVGVNHIDPALAGNDTGLTWEEMQRINSKMLTMTEDRESAYRAWKIGEPFDNKELGCCELKLSKPICMKSGSVLVNERKILKNKVISSSFFLTGTAAASVFAASVITAGTGGIALAVLPLILGIGSYRSLKGVWNYGKENLFALSVRDSIQDISWCVFDSLKKCGLFSEAADKEKIVISVRNDGTVRVYLDGSDEDSEIFSKSIAQVYAPIEDQRYAIQRFEVFVPKGGAARLAYLFRYGINKYSPVLSAYHPLPELFSVKERALVFQKNWNKYVSPGDVVFLKGEKGREVIERYGRINSLGARKMNLKIWK